jgi:hypothetical protein
MFPTKQAHIQILIMGFVIAFCLYQYSEYAPEAWLTIVSMVFGWVCAEFGIDKLEAKNEGDFVIPHTHYHINRIVVAYPFYFVSILVATLAGELGKDTLLSALQVFVSNATDKIHAYHSIVSFAASYLAYRGLRLRDNDQATQTQTQTQTQTSAQQ